MPRADGGRRRTPYREPHPEAFAKYADLKRLDVPRAPGFTQLMDGSLARLQQHSAEPNALTGVGQGVRRDPRFDPPAHSTAGLFLDQRPAPGTHAGGPVYSSGLATARFWW